jgi:hypothetical protein
MGRITIGQTTQPVDIPSVSPAAVRTDDRVSTALSEASKTFTDIAEYQAGKSRLAAQQAPTRAMDVIIKQFESARNTFEANPGVNEADVRNFNNRSLLDATKTAISMGVPAVDIGKIQSMMNNILIDTTSRFEKVQAGNAYTSLDTLSGGAKTTYLDGGTQRELYTERAVADLSPSQQYMFNQLKDTNPQGGAELVGKTIALKAQTDNNLLAVSNVTSQSDLFTANKTLVKQTLIPQEQNITDTLYSTLSNQADSIIQRLRDGVLDGPSALDEFNRLYEEQTIGDDSVDAYISATGDEALYFNKKLDPYKKHLTELINLNDPKTGLQYDNDVLKYQLDISRQQWLQDLPESTKRLFWSPENAIQILTQSKVFKKTAKSNDPDISDASMAFFYQGALKNRREYEEPLREFSSEMSDEEFTNDISHIRLVEKFGKTFKSYLNGYHNLTEDDEEHVLTIKDLVVSYTKFRNSPNYPKVREDYRAALDSGYNTLLSTIATSDPKGAERLKKLAKETVKPFKL